MNRNEAFYSFSLTKKGVTNWIDHKSSLALRGILCCVQPTSTFVVKKRTISY
ncbi:protein of unknown function [Paenibacillus alvei]|uniref:Uncharacterized protein n=1 Tax=Paenibacillus alvei TaxID=44250 RepID=A0A383RHV5_PAEAL|nr:protein of unknown function [Paenibacillus alvei]